MKYIKPEMDVIRFKKKEIVTASSVEVGGADTPVEGDEGGEF